ncbi:MAG: hypothetical protein C0507_06800 [Cyanobacteria bacterium PR.3.49]|jgi:hypothetical protein|nr:hypothetical protein [Cyanobacteria bacterium PR.3.49]
MNKPGETMLIGELLRRAKLVTVEDLANAMQVSGKSGLPIGRVLVMLDIIRNDTLKAAILAQSLVRDKLLTLETAVKAVEVAAARRLSLTDSLEYLGCLEDVCENTNKLGDLLVGAELVTRKQVEDALHTSQHLGLPLGRILVLKNFLPSSVVQAALTMQQYVRDGVVEREDSVKIMRSAKAADFSLDGALIAAGFRMPDRPNIRLGELLVLAEVVSETDLITALEFALSVDMLIGQALMQSGFINEGVLDAALGLQEMVRAENMTPDEAAEALSLIHQHGWNVENCMSEINKVQFKTTNLIGLVDLLKLAGLLSDDGLRRAITCDGRKVKPFEEILLNAGQISEATLHIAVRCQAMIDEGTLSVEQAIVALHHWQWSGSSLPEIINKFGWKTQARRQIQKTIHDLPAVSNLAVKPTKQATWEPKKDKVVS